MARNYRKEYDEYHKSSEQKKRRAARNKARATAMKAGKVRKGDGLEVDHLGFNRKGKLGSKVAIVSKKKNRSRQPKRSGKHD